MLTSLLPPVVTAGRRRGGPSTPGHDGQESERTVL